MTIPLELRGELAKRTFMNRDTPANAAGPPNKYLQFVVRVDHQGKATVVSAVEVPGAALISDAAVGNFAFEITEKDNESVIVHSIPDPFEGRAFASPATPQDPKGKPEGHHEIDRKTIDIVVRLPNTTLDQAIDNHYAIRFYSIKSGEQHIRIMNHAALGELHSAGRVTLSSGIPANQLGPQLRAVGKKIEAR